MSSNNQSENIQVSTTLPNGPAQTQDLLTRVKGMYRLLYLYKEQGSGGLVDKVLIAQESLAGLMHKLAPQSYSSLTKIDFAMLDNIAIQPVGIYGDKDALVRFMSEVIGLDDQSAAYLLAPTDTNHALNYPTLSSGLYFLLPDVHPDTMETDQAHRAFVIYWPEDTTWDDNAIGAVRRNRTTFMRYLTKLTPQVRCLMSDAYANSLVWKGAEQVRDDDDDGFGDDGYDDEEIVHERLFKFEVSKKTEQEEGADIYPGFEFMNHIITVKSLASGITLPASVHPSVLDTRLVSGDNLQGFLTSTFMPPTRRTEAFNPRICSKTFLSSTIDRYRKIHLGGQLDEEGFFILIEDGGLKKYFPDFVTQWKDAIREVDSMREKERKEALAKAEAYFAATRDQIVREVKVRLAQAIVEVYPILNPAKVLSLTPIEQQMTDKPELLRELYNCYPSMGRAEKRVIENAKITDIDDSSYRKIKTRLLEREDVLMESERLSPRDLEALMDMILKDGKKDEGLLHRIYTFLAPWLSSERKPPTHQNVSDPEFLSKLKEVVSKKQILWPFLRKMVLSVIYPWVTQKFESITQMIMANIDEIYKRESVGEAKSHADASALAKRKGLLNHFKDSAQRYLSTDSNALCLTIDGVHRSRGSHNFSTLEVTGHWESITEAYIQYTLFPLTLTESDRASIQENVLFIPRPWSSPMATFNLAITDSIRHVHFLGNKVLLIVDGPSGVDIWLNDISKITYGRPIKQLPSIGRRYHFAISEQRRLIAIVFMDSQCHIWVQLQSFDETVSVLQGLGSPVDVSAWYQDGQPDITHVCFAGGHEEICLVERSGRARIYSFVSQGFRAAILQIPPSIDIQCVLSSVDNSSMVVVERMPVHGFLFRVYHWNSFGQLPEGFVLTPPDSDGLSPESATEFGITTIVQRSNVALIALIPSRYTIKCFNLQIKTKNTLYSFKSKDGRNTKVLENTIHNCLIDCHSDVWTRYPVVPAIRRETISAEANEGLSTITFVCHHDSHLFSGYFKRMIREFEDLTKKPTDGVLNAIRVSAETVESIMWDSLEARTFKSGEWFVELLCLIPIHIALAQYNGFIPLKDGIFDSMQEQRLLGATVDQIINSISLGWYESIFNSYMAAKPVKVISSMGEQSVGMYCVCFISIYNLQGLYGEREGKSFALNHVVDSSFAGSALRTTEGVWLSVCPTKETLVVALDFEGVHSIERSPQEDMLLVLFNTAISNMVLFRNNFALSRDVANMFTSFQASTALLDPATNPNLFKSLLTIIIKVRSHLDHLADQFLTLRIKDVVENDKKEIVKEFIVCDEQEANFITVLHNSQLSVIPWPVIQSRSFYTLFGRVKALLLKQPTTHATAGEFLLTLKALMAKLKAQDWGAIDQNLARHRVSIVKAVLPTALASGYAELSPEPEELRNLDNQTIFPWGEDMSGIVFCLSRSPADRTAALSTLVNMWKNDAARYDITELLQHLNALVSRRLARIQEWVKLSVSRFPDENAEIRSLKSAMGDYEEELKAGILLCLIGCSSCHLPCLLPRGHDPTTHDCQTSHYCVGSCDYVDQHFEDDKEMPCGLFAGHAGRHL
ncbi:hypothetical protein FRC02_010614 [Tulasnella sp. 418]|nr:hypothetical protein FRC02_010614 [Tulasnella sp. 418]